MEVVQNENKATIYIKKNGTRIVTAQNILSFFLCVVGRKSMLLLAYGGGFCADARSLAQTISAENKRATQHIYALVRPGRIKKQARFFLIKCSSWV